MMTQSSSPDKLVEYLTRVSGEAVNFKAHLNGKFNVETTQQFLTRKGEGYGAIWRKPLKNGQGKNYIEYLRLLQKPEETGINESYLLVPELQKIAQHGVVQGHRRCQSPFN